MGRLAVQKDFPALVDAFAILRREHPARLVILGEGPERGTIEALIRRRASKTTSLCQGSSTTPMRAWRAWAEPWRLPLAGEGLPTVLIEALAVGTPVVATDCPSGPREILRTAVRQLVPPGDAPSLAGAIACALTSGRPPVPCPTRCRGSCRMSYSTNIKKFSNARFECGSNDRRGLTRGRFTWGGFDGRVGRRPIPAIKIESRP